MRFLNFPVQLVALLLVSALTIMGCKQKTRLIKSPPHYNFSTVYTDKLDLKLQEISGIAWDTKNNVFLAIDDGSNKLFFLDKENKIILEEYVFGNTADYEDVAILKGIPYILRSDGMITKFIKDSSGKVYGLDIGTVSLSGTNDFETMYSDPGRNALVLVCKNCETDDEKSVSAFAFYPDSIGFDTKPLYVMDAAKIKALSPFSAPKFQPSAGAIHPILQKLFILSSASKQLVIADLNGKVESVYRLSPKLFTQPEGITFKEKGDMYISNEGVNAKATLLKFTYIAITDSAKIQLTKTGYNFSVPDEKMELGKQLHEISGMAYIPGKNVILSENDEKGDIFMVDFKNKNENTGKVKFGGKSDYEDIVHTDTAEYILVSTGAVVQVDTKDSLFSTQEYLLGIEGENEFEAMYMDADRKTMILLCKQCDHEKDEIRAAYRFDPSTKTFSVAPAYTIDIKEIQKILNDDKAEFKPSAAGINPVTGKLFIVASVGKLLVIADKSGKVEEVFRLDPVLFNQPEGLTFAPNGDLYISNEGGEGIATILKFNYKKK
ncbi:MAG: SdiA-regulated domain-containing protein [Chitinophagaceae bacterium]